MKIEIKPAPVRDVDYELTPETFRRILNAASHNLLKCKQMEGSNFPKSDAHVLEVIHTFMSRHREFM